MSRPSHHSNLWWPPHQTILRPEYHKAARAARKHHSPHVREDAGTSKAGYYKAIKAAKNRDWSSFLLTATPQSLWTAKMFAYRRAQPRFPSLPGAETPLQMNNVLLDHFFPPKEPFSPPPRLRPHKSAPPLTTVRKLRRSPSAPRPRLPARTGFHTLPGNRSTKSTRQSSSKFFPRWSSWAITLRR